MSLHLKIEKGWKRILLYVTIIGSLTGGFTLAGGIQWLHGQLKVQRKVEALEERVTELEIELKYHHKVNELNWQFARNMTDDNDKNIYAISWGQGINDQVKEVDVRNNNEGVEFGFVYDLWTIYPIRHDSADSTRKELDFMYPRTGEEKYLPLRKQPI